MRERWLPDARPNAPSHSSPLARVSLNTIIACWSQSVWAANATRVQVKREEGGRSHMLQAATWRRCALRVSGC